jgi:hypothetical protein
VGHHSGLAAVVGHHSGLAAVVGLHSGLAAAVGLHSGLAAAVGLHSGLAAAVNPNHNRSGYVKIAVALDFRNGACFYGEVELFLITYLRH